VFTKNECKGQQLMIALKKTGNYDKKKEEMRREMHPRESRLS
jgi:hypothetical protein